MLFRGLLGTNYSGAVDGLIAARNAGGAYFRNRTTPTDPNTSRQVQMRNALGDAYAAWIALTPNQRAVWESYARSIDRTNRVGDKRHNSGWNEYVRAFTYRRYADTAFGIGITTSLTTIVLPQPSVQTPMSLAITTANTDANFTFDETDPWWDDNESVLLVELSGVRTSPGTIVLNPYPATRNFFKGPWQLATYIQGSTTASPRLIDLTTTPTQYQRVFWRARISSLTRGLGPIINGIAIAP